jgi:hypothetical protein
MNLVGQVFNSQKFEPTTGADDAIVLSKVVFKVDNTAALVEIAGYRSRLDGPGDCTRQRQTPRGQLDGQAYGQRGHRG